MEFIRKHLSALLICAFEIIIGILLLINPLGFTQGIFIAMSVWVFTGISLIVEDIFDAVTMWFTTDHLKA